MISKGVVCRDFVGRSFELDFLLALASRGTVCALASCWEFGDSPYAPLIEIAESLAHIFRCSRSSRRMTVLTPSVGASACGAMHTSPQRLPHVQPTA